MTGKSLASGFVRCENQDRGKLFETGRPQKSEKRFELIIVSRDAETQVHSGEVGFSHDVVRELYREDVTD